MEKFNKANFINSGGGYVMYKRESGEVVFFARHKHRLSPIKPGAFKNFIIKNFTVDEYLAASAYPGTPVGAAKSKGFTY